MNKVILQILVDYILPVTLSIGILAYGIKIILHFKILKLQNRFDGDISFIQFMQEPFKNFLDKITVCLPFYLPSKTLNNEQNIKRIKQINKYIIICLILFWFGILMIPIGIKVQNILINY